MFRFCGTKFEKWHGESECGIRFGIFISFDTSAYFTLFSLFFSRTQELILIFCLIFQFRCRAILQEPTTNVPRGRQTLCNLHRPNDIASVNVIENSTNSLINRLLQRGNKKSFAKHFTSFETTNRINQTNTNFNLNESVGCRPSVEPTLQRHKAQTCRRRSQKQTTTNQSHVEIRTSNATTKTPAPNCNYRQVRKTYSNSTNNGNHDCINNNNITNTNTKTEWYIELASNCYRNGFQLHVNHLDECSKHPCVLQRKPAQAAFLRLPSSALLFRSSSSLSSSPSSVLVRPPSTIESCDSAISLLCSSPKSITVASHCDKTYSNNSFSDKIPIHCRPQQLNTGENKRIYCKNHSAQTCDPSQHYEPIDVHSILPIIDKTPIAQQPTVTEQFNVLNAKNNMNSVAVDANNLQQNLQLSCQTIQYNYQNNNLTFYREYQTSGQQEPRTIANNNNYQHHWVDRSNPNSISFTDQRPIDRYHKGIEVRSTDNKLPTPTENPTDKHTVNDLIEAFNSSFDVSEANHIQLPQIILSDFSSDQPTPPTTPLFYTVETSSKTLSEHPPQLQEYQFYRNTQPFNT